MTSIFDTNDNIIIMFMVIPTGNCVKNRPYIMGLRLGGHQ